MQGHNWLWHLSSQLVFTGVEVLLPRKQVEHLLPAEKCKKIPLLVLAHTPFTSIKLPFSQHISFSVLFPAHVLLSVGRQGVYLEASWGTATTVIKLYCHLLYHSQDGTF